MKHASTNENAVLFKKEIELVLIEFNHFKTIALNDGLISQFALIPVVKLTSFAKRKFISIHDNEIYCDCVNMILFMHANRLNWYYLLKDLRYACLVSKSEKINNAIP